MAPEGGSDATDGATVGERTVDETAGDGREAATGGTGSPLVDRWLALDRGWQALALGLGIVAVHAAGQLAGRL